VKNYGFPVKRGGTMANHFESHRRQLHRLVGADERRMARQSDLFRRAAECQRRMKLALGWKKQLLKQQRDMWIVLASESPSLTNKAVTDRIVAIEQVEFAFHSAFHKVKSGSIH
jgi:hypothetical protein